MSTYIANGIFIIFILFWTWFVVCSTIYRHKPGNDSTGHQSERQKKNDDYDTDYFP